VPLPTLPPELQALVDQTRTAAETLVAGAFHTAEVAGSEATMAASGTGAAIFAGTGILGSDTATKVAGLYNNTLGGILDQQQGGAAPFIDTVANLPLNDLDHPQVFLANTLAGVGLGAPQMVIQGAADNVLGQALPGVEVPELPALPVPDIANPVVPHASLPVLPEVTLPQMTLPQVMLPQVDLPGLLALDGLTTPEPAPGDPTTVISDTLAGLGSADPREVLDSTLHDLGAGGVEDTVNQTLTGLGAADVLHTVSDATAGLGLF
jgi:hypothetical protein